MKSLLSFTVLALLAGAQEKGISPALVGKVKAASTESIIQKLRNNPDLLKNPNEASIWIEELGEHPKDPQTIPALRELFVQAKLNGTAEPGVGYRFLSQRIAGILMKLGLKDEVYFEELAKYAREAVESNPPEPYLLEERVKGNRKGRNPQFVSWCEARDLDFGPCMDYTLRYYSDVMLLSGIRDRRAIPILRRGLHAERIGIVESAALGLGLLNDKESLSLIAQVAAGLPPQSATGVIVAARNYEDPAILTLFDRFIDNSQDLATVRKEWHKRHNKPTNQEEK